MDREKIVKAIVGPNQQPIQAEFVEVEKAEEKWNEYRLADGTFLRIKPVVTEVWRAQDEYDSEGNPRYIVKSQVIMAVTPPPGLKKGVQ